MVFNATFNNISVISWRSVLLVEETGVPEENHRPVASHWQNKKDHSYLNTRCQDKLCFQTTKNCLIFFSFYFQFILMYIFRKLSLILYQTVVKNKLSVRLVYVRQEVRAVLTAFMPSRSAVLAHEHSEHKGPMLSMCTFLMLKHWLCWKYQYNKYMFNFIDIYSFIPVGGCVGRGPIVLLWPEPINAVKTALTSCRTYTSRTDSLFLTTVW
jgi:hypothetical protein